MPCNYLPVTTIKNTSDNLYLMITKNNCCSGYSKRLHNWNSVWENLKWPLSVSIVKEPNESALHFSKSQRKRHILPASPHWIFLKQALLVWNFKYCCIIMLNPLATWSVQSLWGYSPLVLQQLVSQLGTWVCEFKSPFGRKKRIYCKTHALHFNSSSFQITPQFICN